MRISRGMVRKLTITVDEDALLAGYRAMAADSIREDEAAEWVDALIGDATRNDG